MPKITKSKYSVPFVLTWDKNTVLPYLFRAYRKIRLGTTYYYVPYLSLFAERQTRNSDFDTACVPLIGNIEIICIYIKVN